MSTEHAIAPRSEMGSTPSFDPKRAAEYLSTAEEYAEGLLIALHGIIRRAHFVKTDPDSPEAAHRSRELLTALPGLRPALERLKNWTERLGRQDRPGGSVWHPLSPYGLLRCVSVEPPLPVAFAPTTLDAICQMAELTIGIAGRSSRAPAETLGNPSSWSFLGVTFPFLADPNVTNRFGSALKREFAKAQYRLVELLAGKTAFSPQYLGIKNDDEPLVKPVWDQAARTLSFGGVVIRDYRARPGTVQEPILRAFQKAKWRPQIRTPFSGKQLRDAIRAFNESVTPNTIQLSGDGTPNGVQWSACS